MKALGTEIFLSPGNKTGLSVLRGAAVENEDQLPDFLVEVHVFRSADMAAAFVAGLEVAGLGNAMAYDWEPETTESNQTVLVAKYDEPRAADGMEVVHHRPTGHDGAAHKKSMDRIMAERAVADAVQAEEAAYVKRVLGDLGASGATYGRGWLRCGVEGGYGVGVQWKAKGGPYRAEMGCEELYEGNFDASEAVARIASEFGVGHDHFERQFVVETVDAPALVDAIRRMGEAVEGARAERKRLMYEDFMSRMKMTGPRRRFLEAGQRSGILVYVRRANKKAVAEGIEIGASEINILVHAGWIEPADRGYRVTEKGAAALAAPEAARGRARAETSLLRR